MANYLHLLLIFLFTISIKVSQIEAADSISSNTSISGTQKKITSNGGDFELGFFKAGNSSDYYLGIWYNPSKITPLTSVWVANRNTPISDPNSSEFKISEDGNLVLLNESKYVIWSSNITSMESRNTIAVLNDTGNFILRDASNSSNVLWQSFDHPGDTWLPGGKLAFNKITGQSQRLTCWKNNDDPSPGLFSLELDPSKGTNRYISLWNLTNRYWSSGDWNDQIFSGVPEMTQNYIYTFEYIDNDKERYFQYSVKNPSLKTRFIMDKNGQVKQMTWADVGGWNLFWSQPKTQCEVYGICGAFGVCNDVAKPSCNCLKGFRQASPNDVNLADYTKGCVRNTKLQCESGSLNKRDKDKFYAMEDAKLPINRQTVQVGSLGECETACLNSCSCSAYSLSNGCSLWHGDLVNVQQLVDGTGNTLYLRLAASELPNPKGKRGIIIGVVISVAVGLIACFFTVCLLIRRRRLRQRKRLLDSSKAGGGTLVMFKYSDLQLVTKNFSEKLGSGGFGSVFKGVLPDSTAIAVKKLEGLQQGEKQFRSEVSTIGTIQHVNLVRLRGFCSVGSKRLLVYEYMPKGSLADQLFHNNSTVMDWNTRYNVALGTARGLNYLHEKCRDCIIHCDIKPENILLDSSFVPKVSDFGLAKLVGRDFSRVLTTMRGTRGYLAPEWISGVPITAKADVYSYGMMLFEIISGRRNSDEGTAKFFPTFAANKLMEGDILSVLDQKLEGDANLEEVARLCKVACWCVQDDENLRPSMGHVVQILEGIKDVNMPPIPRSLQILGENPENIVFFSNFSSAQSSQVRSTTSDSSQAKSSASMSSRD